MRMSAFNLKEAPQSVKSPFSALTVSGSGDQIEKGGRGHEPCKGTERRG